MAEVTEMMRFSADADVPAANHAVNRTPGKTRRRFAVAPVADAGYSSRWASSARARHA